MHRIFIHVMLVILALVVFWLGVIAGPRVNSILGNLLMMAATAVLFGNLVWMYFSIKRRQL